LESIPSGDALYRGCEKCRCIWIFSKDGILIRRVRDDEALEKHSDGLYYMRGEVVESEVKIPPEMQQKVSEAMERQREMGIQHGGKKRVLIKARDCYYRIGVYCDAPNKRMEFCNKRDDRECDIAVGS